MRFLCCFCGRAIDTASFYSISIELHRAEEISNNPSQELFCHTECIESRLADSKLLYLKYLLNDNSPEDKGTV